MKYFAGFALTYTPLGRARPREGALCRVRRGKEIFEAYWIEGSSSCSWLGARSCLSWLRTVHFEHGFYMFKYLLPPFPARGQTLEADFEHDRWRTRVHRGWLIGLLAVLALGGYGLYRARAAWVAAHAPLDIQWVWWPATADAPAKFSLGITQGTWEQIAARADRTWPYSGSLSEDTMAQVAKLVELAMKQEVASCPRHWRLLSIKPLEPVPAKDGPVRLLPNGGLVFSGRCLS